MSSGLLDELMERASALPEDEKLRLADFLTRQARATSPSDPSQAAKETQTVADAERTRRDQHMAWLKANRDQYAGQYVALDGPRLVGTGATVREAAAAARQQGVGKPFIVYVFASDSLPFAGWHCRLRRSPVAQPV